MRWVLLAAGIIALVILAVVVIGFLLPVRHVVTRTATLNAPVDRVWRALVDIDAFPSWRRTIRSAQKIGESPLTWRETDSHNQSILFAADEMVVNQRLVARIADRNLPFGGTWTYELQPAGAGTTITITERGEVYNPIFRFMSRFVFGHAATMESYLAALRPHVEGPGT